MRQSNAAGQFQVATPNSTTDYYVLGAVARSDTAVNTTITIWDAVSGTPPAIASGNIQQDSAGRIWDYGRLGVIWDAIYTPVYPVKVINGIRAQISTGAGGDAFFLVYYLEERK